MAIQGKFVLQQTSLLSTTQPVEATIWLHWDMDLCGAAAQLGEDQSPAVYIMPPGEFTAPTGPTDNKFNGFGLNYNVLSGTRTVPQNTLVQLVPGLETDSGESANYMWTYTYGSGLGGFLLSTTEDDAYNGIYLSNQATVSDDNKLDYTGGAAKYIWGGQPVLIGRGAVNTIPAVALVTNRVTRQKASQVSLNDRSRVHRLGSDADCHMNGYSPRMGKIIQSMKEVLNF